MMALVLEIIIATWNIVAEMAFYLILGFLIAGILSVYVKESFISRHLGGRGFMAAVRGALVGVPMPLCSCGVIPVTASLYRHRAGKGATISFLASTPQTGVDSIAATWGLMGPFFALIRVVVAFLSGITAGFLVDRFDGSRDETDRKKSDITESEKENGSGQNRFIEALRYGFIDLPGDIGRALLIGLVVAGLLGAVLPESFFSDYLSHDWMAYLAITAIAIPLYVCSTGSIPLAYGFMSAGISPGAALVFLIAGPATNMATITTLWKLMGRKTTLIYLLVLITIAWLSGILLDMLPVSDIIIKQVHDHNSGPGLFQQVNGVFLMFMLANALIFKFDFRMSKEEEKVFPPDLDQFKIDIEGMNCNHCTSSVERALLRCQGIESVRMDLEDGHAMVWGKNYDQEGMREEIEALGFSVVGIDGAEN